MEPIGFNRKRVSEIMQRVGVDVLVASSTENVFYASGLPVRSSEADPILYALSRQLPSIVVIGQDGEEALVTWQLFMSVDKASWIRNVKGVFSRDEAASRLVSSINEAGLPEDGTIGIESLMPQYQYYMLEKTFPHAKIRNSDDIFMELRLIKSDEEIARIRKSTRITEKTIESLIGSVREGISDIELVKAAKIRIIEEGATGFSHVDVGIGGSDAQYPVSGVAMKKGDIAKLDVGVVYGGYCSDINRLVSLGPVSKSASQAIELMIGVQQACEDVIKPGIEPLQVIEVGEEAYKKIGGEGFYFSTIHGLGILIDEFTFYDTMLGSSSKPFERNMVINIESMTIVPPQGFIGVEDTYLVKDSGLEKISTLKRTIYEASKKSK
jgi:Xaa-Pro dipeptidase